MLKPRKQVGLVPLLFCNISILPQSYGTFFTTCWTLTVTVASNTKSLKVF